MADMKKIYNDLTIINLYNSILLYSTQLPILRE